MDWSCRQNDWQPYTQAAAVRRAETRLRKQGRPKLRYKDNLKRYLNWSSIKQSQLEAAAADRAACWSLTSRATAVFEEDRRQRFAAARERRARSTSIPVQTTEYQCDTWGCLCASSFGLRSHMRSHGRERQILSSSDTTDYRQLSQRLLLPHLDAYTPHAQC